MSPQAPNNDRRPLAFGRRGKHAKPSKFDLRHGFLGAMVVAGALAPAGSAAATEPVNTADAYGVQTDDSQAGASPSSARPDGQYGGNYQPAAAQEKKSKKATTAEQPAEGYQGQSQQPAADQSSQNSYADEQSTYSSSGSGDQSGSSYGQSQQSAYGQSDSSNGQGGQAQTSAYGGSSQASVTDVTEKSSGKYVAPAEGQVTSTYGPRGGAQHNGLDIANSIGTPIKSVTDGTVIDAGPASGFGQWVRVQHSDGTITVYGHVASFSVSTGEDVKAGQQIATMGNEGQSTGPHLHFEVHENGTPTDPQPWLQERGVEI